MHLNQLQSLLEDLNQVNAPLRVTEVLLPPRDARLLRGHGIRTASEQVFAWQEADELQLGVYIDPRLQCQLAFADPRRHLHDHNLPALLAASEGISHFLALSWAATASRQISALELELQAEIDKFVLAVQMAANAGVRSLGPDALFARMFERSEFANDLDAVESERYRTAHRAAARLLLEWLNRYHGDLSHPACVAELRRFYRMPREAKLRRSGS